MGTTPVSSEQETEATIHRAHQTWTIGNWKNAVWSCEPLFVLQLPDGWVIIWKTFRSALNQRFRLLLLLVVVWGIFFSQCTQGSLLLTDRCSNTTVYLSIAAVHPCIYHHVCISFRFPKHENEITVHKCHSQLLVGLNPIEHFWDVVERKICNQLFCNSGVMQSCQ